MRNPIVVAILLAAACADQPDLEQQAAPDTTAESVAAASPQAASTITVTVTDTAIQLSRDSMTVADSARISFSIQNRGSTTKEIAIEGGSLGRWATTPVRAGESVLLSVVMPRGQYQVTGAAGGTERAATFTVK